MMKFTENCVAMTEQVYCWFCHRELEGEAVDNHHLIPVRFTRTKRGETVKVHRACHTIFHNQFDHQGQLSKKAYLKLMNQTNYGFGLLKKGTVQ